MNILECRGLMKKFGPVTALDGMTAEIRLLLSRTRSVIVRRTVERSVS